MGSWKRFEIKLLNKRLVYSYVFYLTIYRKEMTSLSYYYCIIRRERNFHTSVRKSWISADDPFSLTKFIVL